MADTRLFTGPASVYHSGLIVFSGRTNVGKSYFARSGLIVFSGRTNVGKSYFARQAILHYLKKHKPAVNSRKKPHLVTFEDPIEQHLFRNITLRDQDPIDLPAFFTPREKRNDVGTLSQALEDALRQTPTVVFVGETRHQEDWKAILEFAATGHLIVTTAHSGSLVELMKSLFVASNADSPAKRGQIARRVFALVHILEFESQETLSKEIRRKHPKGKPAHIGETLRACVPALWTRTAVSIARIVNDGLA